MKAPNKIWINSYQELPCSFVNTNSIEYVRTDAFIKKACEWLNNFYNEDTRSYLIDKDIEDFINYMKGK